jgi:hypothetical protein
MLVLVLALFEFREVRPLFRLSENGKSFSDVMGAILLATFVTFEYHWGNSKKSWQSFCRNIHG